MICSRTILNFVIIVQYISHDESTLMYMNHAFEKIDKFIDVFNQFRLVNRNDEFTFNIFKLHVMTHYRKFIQRYKNSMNIDFDVDEIDYKIMFKKKFESTKTKSTNNKYCNTIYVKSTI